MAGRQAPGRLSFLMTPPNAVSSQALLEELHDPQTAAAQAKTGTQDPADRQSSPTDIGHPLFAQPQPTPDPTKFKIRHPSDNPAYQKIDQLNAAHKLKALPFPAPCG